GFSDAIANVYPMTQVQRCIVHAVRNSLKFVGWKERKQIAAELPLETFRKKWDSKHPIIGEQWSRDWEQLSVLFAYPADIRRAIYTTNAIESLNHSLRKVLKNKKAFPSEDALMKVLYLSIERASKKWTMPIQNWGPALARFAMEFGDRVPNLRNINL
ncbi:MAG: transposase, partial [Rubritalea sp.]|uniref:transposase n=1 Tax=Rubritalea sp. TaxID=2109375 RepID=UPI0032424ED0